MVASDTASHTGRCLAAPTLFWGGVSFARSDKSEEFLYFRGDRPKERTVGPGFEPRSLNLQFSPLTTRLHLDSRPTRRPDVIGVPITSDCLCVTGLFG